MKDYRTKDYRTKDSSPQQPSPPPVQRVLKQHCQILVLPFSARAWSYYVPEPSSYMLTSLRGPTQNVHFHHRVRRSALRGRGSTRVTADYGMGRAQSASQSWFKHSFPVSVLKQQLTLFTGLVGWVFPWFYPAALGRRGGVWASARPVAGRAALGLDMAAAGAGGGKVPGRLWRWERGGGARDLHRGRLGGQRCGTRGPPAQVGVAGRLLGDPAPPSPMPSLTCRAGPTPQPELQPGTRSPPRTGDPRCGRGVSVCKRTQPFTGG